jgi:NAD(P)-dependent dehydrogenase (short-subunit alcohol dehydrogenase family)
MSKKNLLRSDSVVLVSGGARGITASCVVRLAERSQCKFILLGRSELEETPAWAKNGASDAELKRKIMEDLAGSGEKPLPTTVNRIFRRIQASREIESTLLQVAAAGGQAEYVSADITDAESLKSLLADAVIRTGPVTGIIHGAGSLADRLIEKKTEKDFETVYKPKITGLENILTCVPAGELDFLVLFSSIVGFYGNVGQADYAIANEILNKSAYRIKRKHPDLHVLSIDWGPWEAGMVTPELKRAFEERNIHLIPVDVGANMLADELAPGKVDDVQVVVGDRPLQPAAEVDSELRHYQITRRLRLDANPFLVDHRIGKFPVLPATCAASWVMNACEQLYPGYRFNSLDNFKVLKGIVFDEHLANEHVLDLQEVSKNGEIVFNAKVWSKNSRGQTFYHYSLTASIVRDVPEVPVVSPLSLLPESAGSAISGHTLYENGTLFHGPSFQGVERVLEVSPGRLVMQCTLPPVSYIQQGQFPVQTANPYIYDAIVQSLLIWTQQYYQAPCLPSSLVKFEQFRIIPFGTTFFVDMHVRSQSENSVVGDMVVQDPQGNVYLRITGLEGTISPQLKRFMTVQPAAESVS